jgi:hypothetical protein
METNANMFTNLTRAFMALSKLDTIGPRSSAMGSALVTSFKVKLINASSFARTALCLRMLMIALFLEKFMAIVDAVISLLKEGHEEFDLADQGSIDKYLGLLI